MRSVIAPLAALLVMTGCSSEPALSLDQQQQAWEQTMRDDACESIQTLTPGILERAWAMDAMAEGTGTSEDIRVSIDAARRGEPYNCRDQIFKRFYEEQLVSRFNESPKGEAG
ncbi:hypothetical protein [Dietzia sp. ANT_WB102]|uniref:hypothetical protein n=1 Tax=Dietzia sp. ANT_WB102 TaxID=2597345 RepID=UPI0011F004C6|nr:hypothetical protein [Dietzia sp. ANT_WB102]KAA0916981.1 hypothetical protein FQ137_12105 [Dietzia sp. ANT_WB102]